jgi:membrane protein GlpM
MIWFIKALFGAAIVILIGIVSRTKNYYLAGLIPLFPTFTLIAHYTVGLSRTTAELKTTILFSMWAIIPYFLYLICFYVLADKIKLEAALACSILVWLTTAAILVFIWNKV